MYRERRASPVLQEVIDKLKGKKPAKFVPMKYSSSDVSAARAVLDRLTLNLAPARSEVAYIREVPEQLNEI